MEDLERNRYVHRIANMNEQLREQAEQIARLQNDIRMSEFLRVEDLSAERQKNAMATSEALAELIDTRAVLADLKRDKGVEGFVAATDLPALRRAVRACEGRQLDDGIASMMWPPLGPMPQPHEEYATVSPIRAWYNRTVLESRAISYVTQTGVPRTRR